MNKARVTRKLREIGGIINSTDLNYNFRVMQEDLQGAIQGLIFTPLSQAELMIERDSIPETELVPGYWCAVSETGKVYEYNVDNDVYKNGPTRYFGPNDGDLPATPYVVDGDVTSGPWLKGWYTMRSDAFNEYQYISTTMGNLKFNHNDWAVWHEVNGVYKWVRVPKWVEIMDVKTILEQHLIGKLQDLHTKDKSRVVNAINECRDEMGWVEDLHTVHKDTLSGAVNECRDEMGWLHDLHTRARETLVAGINEVRDDIGWLEELTTKEQGTVVKAISECRDEMGWVEDLHTVHKDTLSGAVNEIHDDLGTLSDLHTEDKSTAVAAINEIHDDLGTLDDLTTDIKSTAVAAINNLDKDMGKVINLTTNDRTNAVSAINELKSEVDALQGSFIYIGRIYEDTTNVTDAKLRNRAAEIMGTTVLKLGWTLVDNEQHEWYYNKDLDQWIDFEQPNIYPALNDVLGTLKGSGDIVFPAPGIPEVINARNSDKLGNQLPAYYATKAYADTKANRVDVLELTNTTPYEPTELYHPATKEYVDEMSVGAEWRSIYGNIEEQIDLVEYVGLRALKSNVLERDGADVYVPSKPYHPATKDYVDTVLGEHKNWGQIGGDIADQPDLQDSLLAKQDVENAWNYDNLVVGTEQPAIPLQGFKIWIDMNS